MGAEGREGEALLHTCLASWHQFATAHHRAVLLQQSLEAKMGCIDSHRQAALTLAIDIKDFGLVALLFVQWRHSVQKRRHREQAVSRRHVHAWRRTISYDRGELLPKVLYLW